MLSQHCNQLTFMEMNKLIKHRYGGLLLTIDDIAHQRISRSMLLMMMILIEIKLLREC